MRFHVLACDYDGTIATNGSVDETTIAALKQILASGRKLILVTGRELDDLQKVFPEHDIFHYIVAENGALLYCPATRQEKILAEKPPLDFIERLKAQGVAPLSAGRCIVATWVPHETTVLETIREFGLELHVIFNKGAVMVLPAAVTKAFGLKAALKEMELSTRNVVGVGDAENDHAFLSLCECSAAVSNALPALKDRADVVLQSDHGAGVCELIHEIIDNDLGSYDAQLCKHRIALGQREDSSAVGFKPYGSRIMIAGPSGSGKSTSVLGLLERIAESSYQYCLIDPEGDYQDVPNAVVLGDSQQAPTIEEILQVLRRPTENAVVNLLGLPLADRPAFLSSLMPHFQDMRSRTGRPHWIIVDEAHHMLPTTIGSNLPIVDAANLIMITVHPNDISKPILATVNTVVAVGKLPHETLESFSKALSITKPDAHTTTLEPDQVLVWNRDEGGELLAIKVIPPKSERRRHQRKYAEGDVKEKSFIFQGQEGKLKLRAQNLSIFMQMAEGVDAETWLFHLRRGDYSKWFHEAIKDDSLAAAARAVEIKESLSDEESRTLIKEAILERYSPPAA